MVGNGVGTSAHGFCKQKTWFAFYSKYSEKTVESMKQENDKIWFILKQIIREDKSKKTGKRLLPQVDSLTYKLSLVTGEAESSHLR